MNPSEALFWILVGCFYAVGIYLWAKDVFQFDSLLLVLRNKDIKDEK